MAIEITEDILAPLVRHLRADPVLQELHTIVPAQGVNPVLGPPLTVPRGDMGDVAYPGDTSLWIFRDTEMANSPYANVEGTGSCAITLAHANPWSGKTRGKSIIFPEIKVIYSCDVTRDEVLSSPIKQDARDKCYTLHKQVSRLLHIKDTQTGGFLLLGPREDGTHALKVVSSYEGRDLTMRPIPSGDGMIEGTASFHMEVFL